MISKIFTKFKIYDGNSSGVFMPVLLVFVLLFFAVATAYSSNGKAVKPSYIYHENEGLYSTKLREVKCMESHCLIILSSKINFLCRPLQ